MKIEYKKVSELILDHQNPRFAELYTGSSKEDDLIEYLLYDESGSEVAQNIVSQGQFYPDEALWVKPQGNKFLVKDGNRRCAAVKALQQPAKYELDLKQVKIDRLPVLVYSDENELSRRIQEQHTHSFFKEWDRIAKALKMYEMHNSGLSIESMTDIDSDPAQLIKLANFYYEAVGVAGDDLKKLLRRGRGNSGGKAIIFERLFSLSKFCGYRFKGKPSYQIEITDQNTFNKYVTALVSYIKANPKTITAKYIDEKKSTFLGELKSHGFVPIKPATKPGSTAPTPGVTPKPTTTPGAKKGSVKKKPALARKQIAPKLRRVIEECYSLDDELFANSKVALSRVTFECVLKYIVENTKHSGKYLKDFPYFRSAFFDKHGTTRQYTDFTKLKTLFTALVTDTGTRKAFEQFDLDRLHQIIHNYLSGAGKSDAKTTGENLMPLVEFMLQDESDLLASLDSSKL